MGGMNNQAPASNGPPQNTNMSSGSSSAMGSPSGGLADVLQVRMEILDQKNQLSLLEDQLKTELARFNSLLNRDHNIEIEIPDTLTMERLTIPSGNVSDSILSRNPMLATWPSAIRSCSSRGRPLVRSTV
jgi:hypothetical protein